jgi:hypothetical protein
MNSAFARLEISLELLVLQLRRLQLLDELAHAALEPREISDAVRRGAVFRGTLCGVRLFIGIGGIDSVCHDGSLGCDGLIVPRATSARQHS